MTIRNASFNKESQLIQVPDLLVAVAHVTLRGKCLPLAVAVRTSSLKLLHETRTKPACFCYLTITITMWADMDILGVVSPAASAVRTDCHLVVSYLQKLEEEDYRHLSAVINVFKCNSNLNARTRPHFLFLTMTITRVKFQNYLTHHRRRNRRKCHRIRACRRHAIQASSSTLHRTDHTCVSCLDRSKPRKLYDSNTFLLPEDISQNLCFAVGSSGFLSG